MKINPANMDNIVKRIIKYATCRIVKIQYKEYDESWMM